MLRICTSMKNILRRGSYCCFRFSSEQSKLIANYWQGQAKMKDENIVFFNQKLADVKNSYF